MYIVGYNAGYLRSYPGRLFKAGGVVGYEFVVSTAMARVIRVKIIGP